MFVITTYPWPVPSAYVELSGYRRGESARSYPDAATDTVESRARHVEEMVGWTGPERIRFGWYRLRLAIRDSRTASRKQSKP